VVDIGFVCSVCLSSESFTARRPLGLEAALKAGEEIPLSKARGVFFLPSLDWVDEMVSDVAGFVLTGSIL
jgi:hypothetical protein